MLRIPQEAPDVSGVLETMVNSGKLNLIFQAAKRQGPGEKYRHWDTIRTMKPPAGLDHREWWFAIKLQRSGLAKPLPLKDAEGQPFSYVLADPIPEGLHEISMEGGGSIGVDTQGSALGDETKDRYLVTSLIAEAITSSQLEGAATTREVAREMIKADRRPRDRSEHMILNNFRTMQRIGKLRNEPLTENLICDIHREVTAGTLDDPADAGRFRGPGRPIDVGDDFGQVFHVPPPADQLEARIAAMCDFANDETRGGFVHPVLRSMILHFWLAYDHPFVDGNGRTARALFYWSMLRHGFWLAEFVSISEIILKGPSKYDRAFLHTEKDDNDLTYFLIYHLNVLRRAFKQLRKYIERKTKEQRELQANLRAMQMLNHRQQALIGHALRHPQQDYTCASHRLSHGVSYETARDDLLKLSDRGLLEKAKIGGTWHFRALDNLEDRLRESP